MKQEPIIRKGDDGVKRQYVSPGFILCQECQARVRPESHPRFLDTQAVYDTRLFNKLFQDSLGTS